MTNSNLQSILNNYKAIFEDESESLGLLTEQSNFEEDIFSRKNFVGHVTASGIILSLDRKQVLLIKHKVLDKFLQPGGHIDPLESPLEAAKREINEETGFVDLEYLPFDYQNLNLPLDIDTHYIPANVKKAEEAHYHHDFRYCFVAKNIDNLRLELNEVSELKWLNIQEIVFLEGLKKVLSKVKSILTDNIPTKFFEEICTDFPKEKIATVIVTHILPDRPFLLNAINNFSELISIIPKPKSINQEVLDKLKNYQVDFLKREEILANFGQIMTRTNKKVIILDIGGYFAPILEELESQFPSRILGIVEDTENGHQKYENINLPFPVVSVARSPLKENEDFLVGGSIIFSADSILRSYNRLISQMKCGVIGYGKIGKSITTHLQNIKIQPFLYYIDPTKMVSAINNNNQAVSKNNILTNSEVIFCASGSKSLDIADFRKLKNESFVISVTSSDDEFDISFLENEYQTKQVAQYITRYKSPQNTFYLLNNGNAVNFIHGASVDNFIFLVQAEILESAKYILNKNLENKLYQLESTERQKIAQIWLKYFNSIK